MAPAVVGEALKGAVLAARFLKVRISGRPGLQRQENGYYSSHSTGQPGKDDRICRGIQKAGPLDAFVTPEPALLPGYTDEVIMAGGTFIQGSSIELSADGPIRPPYIIYLQGGLSLAHIKTGLVFAAHELQKKL